MHAIVEESNLTKSRNSRKHVLIQATWRSLTFEWKVNETNNPRIWNQD